MGFSPQDHAEWIAAARRDAQRFRSPGGSSAYAVGNLQISHQPAPVFSDFDVIRVIHRGGQGVVYEARQRSIPRTVALKVMRGGPFAGEGDRIRFEREIEILARLRHRHIVGILDRGETAGSHFLVMDFVDGQPLDRFVRQHDLDRNARLDLFIAVCEAVAAAHLRGVIHRDLKPSNILIDALGEPRILDFGLAAIAGSDASAGATMTGQFLGSLPWVSPEQAAGRLDEVDVRSDVYSLGVMLYHLVTDAMPYSVAGNLEAALQRIRTAQATPPRTVARDVGADLEAIILKALQKEPARRYQSVSELADDLRRLRRHEPVLARRDRLGYVLRRTLRRHRAATALAAAFAFVISAGFITAVVLWQRAATERDRAARAESAERTQRARAEAEAEKARSVNNFLQAALAAANPDATADRAVSVRELLDRAIAQIDAGALADQPQIAAAVRGTVGKSYLALGRSEEAVRQFESALELLRAQSAELSEDEVQLLDGLANAHIQLQHPVEAEIQARAALAASRSMHPGDDDATVTALRTLAEALGLQGRRDENVALRTEALAMKERLVGPDDPDVLHSRLVLALTAHDVAASEQLVRRLMAQLDSIDVLGDLDAARIYRTIAAVMHLLGDFAASEQAYAHALTATRAAYGPDHPREVDVLTEIAFMHRSRGDADRGEAALIAACDVARRAYGETDSRYADLLVQQCALALGAEDFARAEALIQQVLAMDAAGNPPDHWTRAQAKSLNGELLIHRNDLVAAEPLLLEGYAGLVASALPGDLIQHAALRLVRLYELTGQAELAAEWRVRAGDTAAAGR